jgi:hypothetical protein
MITMRQIRRIVFEWFDRKADKRLAKHIPGYLERKHRIEAAKRSHKKAAAVYADQKAAMTHALREGR